MVVKPFLSWWRPTHEQQQDCAARAGGFNYRSSFEGASALGGEDKGLLDSLSKEGFSINRARFLLGSGSSTYTFAMSAINTWRHFGLRWAFVDPQTSLEKGRRFCVCVHEILPWIMMPLQIIYVTDASVQPRPGSCLKASFGFGSGTLHGHLLAGEERFSVQWDENDQVWYEIFSFSKPAHILSTIGYPYARFRQKYFAQKSAEAVLKYVAAQHLVGT